MYEIIVVVVFNLLFNSSVASRAKSPATLVNHTNSLEELEFRR
jgi:hypothetical protein